MDTLSIVVVCGAGNASTTTTSTPASPSSHLSLSLWLARTCVSCLRPSVIDVIVTAHFNVAEVTRRDAHARCVVYECGRFDFYSWL